jgi:toxin ParE1/3/4
MLVIASWLALYEITKGGVRIMRVVDAARDLGELDLSGERERRCAPLPIPRKVKY